MVKVYLNSRRLGLLVIFLIVSALLLSIISLYTETKTYTFKKIIYLYDNNIVDLTSIINEELLYRGITRTTLQIKLIDCNNSVMYEIIDTYHNITKTYSLPPNGVESVSLTSPFSVIVFNNTSVSYGCKANLSITITYNERKYAILSIPAFIIGAISLFLMMLFLVEYTVTKIYEKKK